MASIDTLRTLGHTTHGSATILYDGVQILDVKYVFHVFHLGAEIRRIHLKYTKYARNTCVFAFTYFI